MTEPPLPKTTGSEYADHILAITRRAAELDDADKRRREAPPPPAATRAPVFLAVLALFAVVVIWNVRAWSPEPEPLPRPIQETALEISLLMATQMVEQYRQETGRLPTSLEEAGVPEDAFTYRLQGDSYELFASEGGVTVRYDSVDGAEALLERLGAMTEPGR